MDNHDLVRGILEGVDEARGMGRGVGGPAQQDGGADECVCEKCGYREQHQRGTPCVESPCPECGAPMRGAAREDSGLQIYGREPAGAMGEEQVDEKCGGLSKKAKKAAGETYSKTKEPEKYYGTAQKVQKAMDKKEGYDAGMAEMAGFDAVRAWAKREIPEGLRLTGRTALSGNTKIAERDIEAKKAKVLRAVEEAHVRHQQMVTQALVDAGYKIEHVDEL